QLHPSVVIADIMMPQLDGFDVLRAIRSDPALSTTPVILLSARAGEEARVEGFQAGADDYLVKPFTARELLTRVGTHVKMAVLRREVSEREGVQQRINRVLAEYADLSEAALQVLRVVCDVLDWTVGGLWIVDQQAAQLRSLEIWCNPLGRGKSFALTSQSQSFAKGSGLPGRVWQERRPIWLPDVTKEPNFPRSAAAAAEGLHAGFGFPVLA